jgi:hypothetical protein
MTLRVTDFHLHVPQRHVCYAAVSHGREQLPANSFPRCFQQQGKMCALAFITSVVKCQVPLYGRFYGVLSA